jgi:hypothetical protein
MGRDAENRRNYHRLYMRSRYSDDAVHRSKQKARAAVGHALRDGRMVKAPCFVCGSPDSQAHHPDYAKPLDVQWLCRDCHEHTHGGPGCKGHLTTAVVI